MTNHTFLILGANGQLGKQFSKTLAGQKKNVVAPDEKDCDITIRDSIARIIDTAMPSVVINCAAYNAVDLAEQQPEAAYLINAEAVKNIAALCREKSILLIHYSTDYVFDGRKGHPYVEHDPPNPLNNYGKSKLAGEEAVQTSAGKFLLFRTSWVFGNGTQNFVYKLLQWSKNNSVLKLTNDEISVPTSTLDLVHFTLYAIEKNLTGLYHLTNSGYASRYEWGKYLAEKLALRSSIVPASLNDFPSPAKRPAFSAMLNEKLAQEIGIPIPHWRNAVDRFLAEYPLK